jgi:hypothetical protein
MNEYKVRLQTTNYNLKLQPKDSFKVISMVGGIKEVPASLQDLLDVNITENDKNDKYVLMFDAEQNKYKLVNPDEVLSASITDSIQPGLPTNFTDQLDVDLDNRIDLDGGSW